MWIVSVCWLHTRMWSAPLDGQGSWMLTLERWQRRMQNGLQQKRMLKWVLDLKD